MVNHRGGWRPVTYQQSRSSSSGSSGSFGGGFVAASGSNVVGSYGFSMGKTRARCSSCCCGVGAGLASFAPSPRLLLLALLVLAIPSFDGGVLACGPGRGGGRRPTLRKLTPLVFKQHVPNVSENTLPASGISEGAIVRHDARFRDLVPNYNSDIIFKDEEGTGADRLMTQRCKEKLNTLAISVMNQWPGVKLRVTEGWDEQGKHAMDSLHYEGRAVDVTTSDRDRSKNGMLARLAVEAGFDWVYYESKSHIHCSVKSESSSVGKSGGCFPARSVVRTEDGSTKRVDELTIGERVAALDSRGDLVYSEVIAFLDRAPEERRQFVRLTTETGRQLTLTPAHLVPVNRGTDVFAAKVKVGDRILVRDDATPTTMDDASIETNEIAETSRLRWDKVVEAKLVLEEGVYAPLTTEGTLLVDDVVASCYAIVDSQMLAHYAFLPLRLLNTIQTTLRAIASRITDGLALSRRADVDAAAANSIETEAGARHDESSVLVQKLRLQPRGVHWYASALYSISAYVLPGSMLY